MMPGNMSARIAFIPKTTKRLSIKASRLLLYKQGNNERKTYCATPSNTLCCGR